MKLYRHPIVAACLAAALFGVALSVRLHLLQAQEPLPIPIVEVEEPTLKERQIQRVLEDKLDALVLSGKAVAVWDVEQQMLVYGRNSSYQLPLASLTKVMLALVVKTYLPTGTILTVSGGDLAEEGSSGIISGHSFSADTLLEATLVGSLNDTANALSRAVGNILLSEKNQSQAKLTSIDLMNEMSRDLGLTQTIFYNEDGLDLGEGQPGALGSAGDAAKYISAFYTRYPSVFLATTKGDYILRSREGQDYRYFNTNQHLEDIPNLLGSKTGYTELAGGNLGIVFQNKGKIFTIVVLGSTKEGRFEDVRAIANVLRSE